jgi:rfaE bifunctional protein kinase chain/domain
MNTDRFATITAEYPRLRIAIVGDFCLDRYLEIDPGLKEESLETGLPVRNVTAVRAQPGGAGTILNNLAALGVGDVYAVGFCGEDGEGFELRRALAAKPGVRLDWFLTTPQRRTFTYCKPLVLERGKPLVELNRLDSKNWTPTPAAVEDQLIVSLGNLTPSVDAVILLDQVDVANTGVVTQRVLAAVHAAAQARPSLLVIADSRRGLGGFPPLTFKMNARELAALTRSAPTGNLDDIKRAALALARQQSHRVFVTVAEQGIVGAAPDGTVEHVPALPRRGEIDIVGAGDAVTANLACALAAGAGLREALELANAAASIVIHQLGTTGTASVRQMGELLGLGE